jgi:hypothetical protein
MRLSALTPELIVSDIQASLTFWCDVVGFSVLYDRPEEGFSYLNLGSAQLMLEQQSKASRNWENGKLEHPFGRGVNFEIRVPALEAVIRKQRECCIPFTGQSMQKPQITLLPQAISAKNHPFRMPALDGEAAARLRWLPTLQRLCRCHE